MDPHEDSALSALLKTQVSRYDAPSELRDRIMVALRPAQPVTTRAEQASQWSAWRQWLSVGAAFACGVLASVVVSQLQVNNEPDQVAQEVVSGHVRSLMAAHLADVTSSDQHTVKPWFTGKLDYSPPVNDFAREGFALVGGRLDYIEKRPVAALVYQHGLHTINVFVWPTDSMTAPVKKLSTRQGFNLAVWKDSGMQFWVVSDASAGELQIFSQLLHTTGLKISQERLGWKGLGPVPSYSAAHWFPFASLFTPHPVWRVKPTASGTNNFEVVLLQSTHRSPGSRRSKRLIAVI